MAQHLKKLWIFLIVLSCAILIVVAHLNIFEQHSINLQAKAYERIGVYQSSLRNELTRFNFLPFVVARDKALLELAFSQPQLANIALEEIRKASKADEIYIMNQLGLTLASSNWRSPLSFVGRNYAYRPYFKQALMGKPGRFYGIGATTKKPGYFISTGTKVKNETIAVTVAKVNLTPLERIWKDGGENVFVTNADNVVVLSSNERWRYKTLSPLNPSQIKIINVQKQFANEALKLLPDEMPTDLNKIKIGNVYFLHKKVGIPEADWELHYLIPVNNVQQLVIMTWVKIGLVLLGILVSLLVFRILKSRAELSVSHKESARLRDLNDQLKDEIVSRQQIEAELLVAQKDIKRSSKLAAMGQLSASITHELSQPLSAMKTYIAGAQLPVEAGQGSPEQALKVLPKLALLVERMSRIAKQLRFFTRSNEKDIKPIDVKEALNSALVITLPLLDKAKVALIYQREERPFMVMAGQARLEQVLVNLINNARMAMEKSLVKKITVSLESQPEFVVIRVRDTGEGLSDEALHMLFEPFYTTKPSGVGLGLGLAISANIISEFGGELVAENNADQGACFMITLPVPI